MDAAGGFRSNREHEVSRRTQNEWPATRRILVSRQRAGKILLRRAASCWDQAALTGARRPTHCIGQPRLSWRGSVPKVLRRSHLQLNRGGCGRCFCFRSRNTAAQVRALARGASNPKYRMLCRPRSGTCWFRMWISSSPVEPSAFPVRGCQSEDQTQGSFRIELLQLNRRGRGRRLCPRNTDIAA
jgi:hypothetical protein